MKIRILDLFCGAGGAAVGYHQGFTKAGFQVSIIGVDHANQPRYPYGFCKDSALAFFDNYADDFDFYHASPPCQQHTALRKVAGKEYQCFIKATRERFKASGKPYVIENVVGAPLESPIKLCGLNVGIPMHGHRLFECDPFVAAPLRCQTDLTAQRCGRAPTPGMLLARPAGRFSGIEIYRQAMGVSWMNQREIAQCIPPAFTRYIAEQLSTLLRKL